MKKFNFFLTLATLAILLGLATPGYSIPQGVQLGGFLHVDNSSMSFYLLGGKQVLINWFSYGIDLQTKLKLTLLKNGVPFLVIATGLSLTNGYKDIRDFWCGDAKWTPGNNDIGCNYKMQLSTEDNTISDTSQGFYILPATEFVSQGKYSYVKLDSPKGGEILYLGKYYVIKWTCKPINSHWPSQKLKLELFYNNTKVGDIANVDLNFNQCPVYGSYNWAFGSNLTPGNFYQIRISGDSSSYFSDNFIIAYPSSKPGSGEKVHKVDQSGIAIDGPSPPPAKRQK